ncbi:MAG TPA: hypothetical protein VMZ73_04280 [Acidimicrobiales bacterium]|nr:hypothetical protein [Acidimicrobiales bacterium]
MRRKALLSVVVVNVAVALLIWNARPDGPDPRPVLDPDPTWSHLDAQGRCDDALRLVTHPDRWPVRCRWRQPGEVLQGQSYPPPAGAPPYDDPHVEIYVAKTQTREQVANAIAHELGHMHHTRVPAFAVADWLAARGLPASTPTEVWTEDYAEVFAALFSPPNDAWRAPTPRPTPDALAALKARFFA